MFETAKTPRIFGLPLGCDFSKSLIDGLTARLAGKPPQDLAQVEIFVNTRRTERRLRDLFLGGPATLLPRIRLITDLSKDPVLTANLPPPISALRRRLQIAQLVAALLKQEQDLAPKSAVYDLADSLANLMDEMHGEGVTLEDVQNIDVSSHSAHWDRSKQFLNILSAFFAGDVAFEPDGEARQRLVVEHLAKEWAINPPNHPVIVAGSTGSRGATAMFMRTVSNLPQGAVVLPGFDFDLPASVWQNLQDPLISADHPQAGFYKMLSGIDFSPVDVDRWTDVSPANYNRNQLISLALRPAPVTDQWLTEGPKLPDIKEATAGVSLLEAQSTRQEANAIAWRLREAAETGQKATLISPDRNLTRMVTAALGRWNIDPDDSAGRPLPLTPPGIFLRLIAGAFGQKLTVEMLLSLLKHPLTHSEGDDRNTHMLRTRDLEIQVLRRGIPYPDFEKLAHWAEQRKNDPAAVGWVVWLKNLLSELEGVGTRALASHLTDHRRLAESLARGPVAAGGTGALWLEEAGETAATAFAELEAEADAGGNLTPLEYRALFKAVFAKTEVRESIAKHPDITIWGTLEARVQGADVVILGGMNDGIWPRLPTPDPWLNRDMRLQAGLLLPERNIGLSAHDFQQAVAGKEVLITRSIRDADAPTVASRWLIRLTNLLAGLGDDGQDCLNGMRERGQRQAALAEALEVPAVSVKAAQRPSPRPPVSVRPDRLSVTRIKILIRDPYAIYARYVLGLQVLQPLIPAPDAMIRGQHMHKVMELFIRQTADHRPDLTREKLLQTAEAYFNQHVPWPSARRLWLARLASIADDFVADEVQRCKNARPLLFECRGEIVLDEPAFSLTGTADRIDKTDAGQIIIYDYKTGQPPSKKQIGLFDKQLPLEAAMAQFGGFEGLGKPVVEKIMYISLARGNKSAVVDLDNELINKTWDGFCRLIRGYQLPGTGYTARARMEKTTDPSDYDHLSRRGEWADTDNALPKDMP